MNSDFNIILRVFEQDKLLLFREKVKNTKLYTRVIACAIYPTPPDVLPQNVTISFTLDEVSVKCLTMFLILRGVFLFLGILVWMHNANVPNLSKVMGCGAQIAGFTMNGFHHLTCLSVNNLFIYIFFLIFVLIEITVNVTLVVRKAYVRLPRKGIGITGLQLILLRGVGMNGEQGRRRGDSARLPPMWPGIDSRTRRSYVG